MKNPLRSLFDSLAPLFESNRLCKPFKPLFQATDAFFFSGDESNKEAPFIRDGVDLKRFMMTVIFALAPCIVSALFFFGPYVISMIVVSYAAGAVVEIAFAIIRKEEINEGFLVSGMLLPLILPVTTPLWVVAIGMAFGVLFGKEIFGGTGHNPLNPALVGRCFIFLAWPHHTAPSAWRAPLQWPAQLQAPTWLNLRAWISTTGAVDAATAATPLALAKNGAWDSVPVMDLLTGNVGGSVGETSAILIILGGLYLTWTKVSNWRPTVSCLAGAWLMGVLMHRLHPEAYAPGWFHLISGGLMFAAVFMVTDPVSGPITNPARYVYGFLIGVLVVFGRCLGGFPEWVTFAVLLMNLFAPLLDEGVWALRFRRLKQCQTQ
ncbi:MAG TPA: RnfABCDGE type electron transport complex subunit D [Sumerlaeia bacterium]|nr:RnfABCDGE type electron transport complex subunit D [Sumerlaeia bacterium]